jgi:hypothetical protein
VKLELDVSTFDAARFDAYPQRCRTTEIRLTTLADSGDTPGHRRAATTSTRSTPRTSRDRGVCSTCDEYLQRRMEVPSSDPRGVVIALDGDAWIGLSAASDHRSSGYLFNEMTGVRTHPPRARHLRRHGEIRRRLRRAVRGEQDPGLPPPRERRRHRDEPAARLRRAEWDDG